MRDGCMLWIRRAGREGGREEEREGARKTTTSTYLHLMLKATGSARGARTLPSAPALLHACAPATDADGHLLVFGLLLLGLGGVLLCSRRPVKFCEARRERDFVGGGSGALHDDGRCAFDELSLCVVLCVWGEVGGEGGERERKKKQMTTSFTLRCPSLSLVHDMRVHAVIPPPAHSIQGQE